MKTKLFTGLALAAALLIAGPAYAKDDHRGGGGSKGHAVAAVHRGGGAAHIAARGSRVTPHANIASRRTFSAGRTRGFVANRNVKRNNGARANIARTNEARANIARTNVNRNGSHKSMAFGGSGYANNGGGHYQYAFASHGGWNHNQRYFWHGHHYGWFNNGWFILDPGYYGPGYNGYNGGPVSVEVQEALSQQGYYRGPIDGVVGPGTSAAIASYQQNNGLAVTGTITPGLLNSLGIS
jgi:hypothetical protein